MGKISLAAARVNAGFSQIFVAKTLDVAPSTLRNWEKGVTFPKEPMIKAMCKLYGVQYDDINFSASE